MNYNFEKFVNQTTEVFADTCFLMNDYFLGRFYPALEQYNRTSSGRKLLSTYYHPVLWNWRS